MDASDFAYDGWSLHEAIDALSAYDLGSIDSGVKDEKLRKAVGEFLGSLSARDFRIVAGTCARQYLTDDMLGQGYGLGDVAELSEWLDDLVMEDTRYERRKEAMATRESLEPPQEQDGR